MVLFILLIFIVFSQEILLNYINEASERYKIKNELRQKNQIAVKPNDAVTGKLDSSLKKNTAFVRKLVGSNS